MTTHLNVKSGAKPREQRCPSFRQRETHWCMARSTVLKNQKQKRTAQTSSSYIPRKDALWVRLKFAQVYATPYLFCTCAFNRFLIGSKKDADRFVTLTPFVNRFSCL